MRKITHASKALLLAALLLAGSAWFVAPAPAAAISAAVQGAAYLAGHIGDVPYYLSGSEFVFITPNGERYHCKDDCPGIETAYLVSIEEACRLGYTACGNCHPTAMAATGLPDPLPKDATIVYIAIKDEYYHAAKHASKKKTACAVTLEEAEYLGKTPCKKCFPSGAPE